MFAYEYGMTGKFQCKAGESCAYILFMEISVYANQGRGHVNIGGPVAICHRCLPSGSRSRSSAEAERPCVGWSLSMYNWNSEDILANLILERPKLVQAVKTKFLLVWPLHRRGISTVGV